MSLIAPLQCTLYPYNILYIQEYIQYILYVQAALKLQLPESNPMVANTSVHPAVADSLTNLASCRQRSCILSMSQNYSTCTI